MTTVAVVFQSGKGHTKVLADAILKGINTVQGTNGDILEIRGCATYMGSASAIFKAFLEAAFKPHWLEQRWKDKIAAGFTNSASQNGDKFSTLLQLTVFAMQMGMIGWA
jgi:multimeric flavodoxin WrbA